MKNMEKFAISGLVVLCLVFGFVIYQTETRNQAALFREVKALGEEIAELRQGLNAFLTVTGGQESRMDDTTDASYIVSDLKTLKTAASMFYSDNIDNIAGMDVSVAALTPYLEPKFDNPVYLLDTGPGGGLRGWWVGFDLKAAGKSESVRERLKGMANSVGLYAAPSSNAALYAGQDVVWMTMGGRGAITQSAEATTIITPLRGLKSAALMFYSDDMETE